jgi:hypothetical protein
MKELERWIQTFTKDWQDRHDRLETMLKKQMDAKDGRQKHDR